MNTRLEMQAALKRELNMVSTSTLFSDDSLNEALWDAYLWVTDRHSFPRLEKAKTTTSTSDYYYDDPVEFKSDSIFKVTVDGQDYDPTEFEDWLKWKKLNPNPTNEYHFANYANQYFIHPIATTTGLEIIVWGMIQPAKFVNDDSVTIFSGTEEAINEGIMRKALSDLLPKDSPESNNELVKAQGIVDQGYNRIKQRRYRFKRKDAPFFNTPDYYATNGASPIGNFNS